MAWVTGPSIPDGDLREIVDGLPYSTPSPFYVGSRVTFGVGEIQAILRRFLLDAGVVVEEEPLVFSWVMGPTGPILTIAKHEANA